MAKKKHESLRYLESAKLFINARGFQIATVVLDASNGPHTPLIFWPMVVNEVFALELFIKALHRLRGRTVTGHDVHKLHGKLSKADKKAIESHFQTIIKYHPNYEWSQKKGIQMDVDSVLLRNRETFKNVRYWHEGESPSRDLSGKATNAGTGSLSDAIWRLILDINPSWTDANITRAITLPLISRPPTLQFHQTRTQPS